jgi:hypothetical protein
MAEEVTTLSIAAALRSDRIVAPPGWSRWLIPPAALSIHLAIGSVYSWSVFKLPLQKTLGLSGVDSALPFTFGIVMLGLAAAVFGTTVERRGLVCNELIRTPKPPIDEQTRPTADATADSVAPRWAS